MEQVSTTSFLLPLLQERSCSIYSMSLKHSVSLSSPRELAESERNEQGWECAIN